MPKINSLEVVHQDTNKDSYQTLHDILVDLKKSLALNQEIVDGEARVAIENLLEMYVNDKEAFLRSLQTLTASFKNSDAILEEEILLKASELEALARKVSTLTAQTETQYASVKEYSEAVASEVARKTTTYSQDAAPVGTDLVYGDIWIDTNDNNRMYSWDGLVWNEVTKRATFRQDTAPTSAADGDIWYDTDDNNKIYRYNALTSSWELTADARVATTYARWGVQVDANGRVAGIQLNSDNTGTSQFTVLAEAFKVYNTSTGLNEPTFAVVSGVVSPKNLNIIGAGGQWILQANTGGVNVRLFNPGMTVGYSDNIGRSGEPAFSAYANGGASEALYGLAYNTGGTNHGVRGKNSGAGTSGLVGVSNGYNFYADGTSTLDYGTFTGAHDVVVHKDLDDIEIGDIVVDTNCLLKSSMSNVLCTVAKTTQPNQKGTVGVLAYKRGLLKDNCPPAAFNFNDATVDEYGNEIPIFNSEWEAMKDEYLYHSINALGEGQINVCGENGNIEIGDLIVSSSIAGKGMKQADDIIRSYTVAKARENVTFSSPTEVKQVACIYLCG